MIVALLAVLEMVRMQAVMLVQSSFLRTFACASTKCSTPFCRARRDVKIEEQYL